MTAFEIPVSADAPAYVEQVELDGVTFELYFRVNTRLNCWFVEVRDGEGAAIIPPRRCVVDLSLLEQHRYVADGPAGRLVLWDTTPRHADPTPADLGARVLAIYLGVSE